MINVSKYETLLNNKVNEILPKKSIAFRIGDYLESKSPNSVAYGLQRDKEKDKMIFQKSSLELKLYHYKTLITKEALYDIEQIFGNEEGVDKIISKYILNDLIYDVDKDAINLLKNRAYQAPKLTIDGSKISHRTETAALMIIVKINKILNDFPLSDNRSEIGFAIVNSDVGALLSVLKPSQDSENDNSPSYLGRISGIDVYIDYTNDNSGTDAVICGTKGNGVTNGSLQVQRYPGGAKLQAVTASNGEPVLHYFYRVGMTINPLDEIYYKNGNGQSGFVGKFDVDLSELYPFKND